MRPLYEKGIYARHELKTWPVFFRAIIDGTKTFEVRENDRNFQVGDLLELREYDPDAEDYTGNKVCKKVIYILGDNPFFQLNNTVIMGIADIDHFEGIELPAKESIKPISDAEAKKIANHWASTSQFLSNHIYDHESVVFGFMKCFYWMRSHLQSRPVQEYQYNILGHKEKVFDFLKNTLKEEVHPEVSAEEILEKHGFPYEINDKVIDEYLSTHPISKPSDDDIRKEAFRVADNITGLPFEPSSFQYGAEAMRDGLIPISQNTNDEKK